jgi:hypothetical protein
MFNIRTISIFVILLIVCSSFQVLAGGRKLGTAGAPELLIPMGAKSVGMAGANIANITNTEAIYYNPAGLSLLENSEATFTYMTYFADMNVSYLTAGIALGELGKLGISLQSLDIGEIEVTTIDVPEGTGEEITPTYLTLGLTYAKSLTNRISFGMNTKLISEKIGNMSASAVAWDFGIQYRSDANVDFGIALKNIGSKIKFDGTGIEYDSEVTYSNPNATTRKTKLDMAEHELPTSLQIGIAYQYNFSEMHKANIVSHYVNSSYSFDQLVSGIEYSFGEKIFLRGGYNLPFFPSAYSSDDKDDYQYGLHLGAGVKLPLGSNRLSIDYAYREMELFEGNNYFTLGFEF